MAIPAALSPVALSRSASARPVSRKTSRARAQSIENSVVLTARKPPGNCPVTWKPMLRPSATSARGVPTGALTCTPPIFSASSNSGRAAGGEAAAGGRAPGRGAGAAAAAAGRTSRRSWCAGARLTPAIRQRRSVPVRETVQSPDCRSHTGTAPPCALAGPTPPSTKATPAASSASIPLIRTIQAPQKQRARRFPPAPAKPRLERSLQATRSPCSDTSRPSRSSSSATRRPMIASTILSSTKVPTAENSMVAPTA